MRVYFDIMYVCTRIQKELHRYNFSQSDFEVDDRYMSTGAQATTKHCNRLQQTITHRNTLQHTITFCNKVQHSALFCNTLQHAEI